MDAWSMEIKGSRDYPDPVAKLPSAEGAAGTPLAVRADPTEFPRTSGCAQPSSVNSRPPLTNRSPTVKIVALMVGVGRPLRGGS